MLSSSSYGASSPTRGAGDASGTTVSRARNRASWLAVRSWSIVMSARGCGVIVDQRTVPVFQDFWPPRSSPMDRPKARGRTSTNPAGTDRKEAAPP